MNLFKWVARRFRNRPLDKSSGDVAADKSLPDDVMMLVLKDEFAHEAGLPRNSCPLRISTFTSMMASGSIDIAVLSDELRLYLERRPHERRAYEAMLARLSYLAGCANTTHDDAQNDSAGGGGKPSS